MRQLSLTYLAFPHGIYPEVELLCNRVCSSFNRIGCSVWHICSCPKYSEHPSYIVVTFPHYNSYLFKASFRKILQLLLQFMCRHVTWVLPIRCIRERLQFRRQHHEDRNTMQNYVNEGDSVWPKNELLELNVTKVLATVCCAVSTWTKVVPVQRAVHIWAVWECNLGIFPNRILLPSVLWPFRRL